MFHSNQTIFLDENSVKIRGNFLLISLEMASTHIVLNSEESALIFKLKFSLVMVKEVSSEISSMVQPASGVKP